MSTNILKERTGLEIAAGKDFATGRYTQAGLFLKYRDDLCRLAEGMRSLAVSYRGVLVGGTGLAFTRFGGRCALQPVVLYGHNYTHEPGWLAHCAEVEMSQQSSKLECVWVAGICVAAMTDLEVIEGITGRQGAKTIEPCFLCRNDLGNNAAVTAETQFVGIAGTTIVSSDWGEVQERYSTVEAPLTSDQLLAQQGATISPG